MTITNYLKEQLTDFVDSYQKYFKKTFGIAVIFTVICFITAAFLLRFSNFDKSVTSRQVSLLSYFFHRYSKGDTYSIVDLIKSVFIFFVALYSIGLIRLTTNDTNNSEFSVGQFVQKLKLKDIGYLLGVLIFVSLLDVAMFKLDSYTIANTSNKGVEAYFNDWIFHFRVYGPLILFALAIRVLTISEKTALTVKRIVLLYISIWLFNEFAYEISAWVRNHLFGIILAPFENTVYYYLFESILGIPLIAFYFLGYYSAMTTSLKLTEQEWAGETPN